MNDGAKEILEVPEVPAGSAPEIARWALKVIALILVALLTYATYTTDQMKGEIQTIKTHQAVDDERYKNINEKLDKIGAIVERWDK